MASGAPQCLGTTNTTSGSLWVMEGITIITVTVVIVIIIVITCSSPFSSLRQECLMKMKMIWPLSRG